MSDPVVAISLYCEVCKASWNLSAPRSRATSIKANWQMTHDHPRPAYEPKADAGMIGCWIVLLAPVVVIGFYLAHLMLSLGVGR